MSDYHKEYGSIDTNEDKENVHEMTDEECGELIMIINELGIPIKKPMPKPVTLRESAAMLLGFIFASLASSGITIHFIRFCDTRSEIAILGSLIINALIFYPFVHVVLIEHK